jgi:hypothetical protein
VALMPSKTYAAFLVVPGRHSLVTTAFFASAFDPLEFPVEPGRSYFFEIDTHGTGANATALMKPIDEGKARRRLSADRYAWLD